MALPPPPPAPEGPPAAPLQEHRFPCTGCGADYRFDPVQGRLLCDHCGQQEPVQDGGPWQGGLQELDLTAALRNALPEAEMEETRVSTCDGCGAQVEFNPTQHAAECPFCATPVVLDTGAHRHIKPKGALPFALDEAAAQKAMTDWFGKLWFAPGGLRAYARQARRMQGIYVPYWTFDAQTRSHYRGQRGVAHHESRTVMRNGKAERQTVTRIIWSPAQGRVARFFDDVLVLASRALPRRFTEGLEPWDLAALEPYRPEYLAGFRAEGYAIGLEEGFALAREKMDRVIERDVKFAIGGDRQRIHAIDTQLSELSFKHVLLPVWVAAYRYKGRSYRFVVNGRTGRVQGERPWSAWKIALAVVLGALVAAGVGYLAAQNG